MGKASGRREMGPPASVHVDVDGESIWALIRCDETSPVPAARGGRFGIDCMKPDGTLKPHDTIFKFDPKGNVVKSFGAQMFIWPHGVLGPPPSANPRTGRYGLSAGPCA